MLIWACALLTPITAQAEGDFRLAVGSNWITADGQITGDPLVQGAVTWDSASRTLTLNNATITSKTDENGAYEAICALYGDLTIKLIGTNRISSDNVGIVVDDGGLTIEGPGSLEITDTYGYGYGIIGGNYLKVSGLSSLTVNVGAQRQGIGLAASGDLEISDVRSLTVETAYHGIYSGCRTVALRNIGNLTVSSQGNAIACTGGVTMSGVSNGTVTSSDGTAILLDYVADGGSQYTYGGVTIENSNVDVDGQYIGIDVSNYEDVTITNSQVDVDGVDVAIQTRGSLTINKSTVHADGDDESSTNKNYDTYGIRAQGITIENGSTVDASALAAALYSEQGDIVIVDSHVKATGIVEYGQDSSSDAYGLFLARGDLDSNNDIDVSGASQLTVNGRIGAWSKDASLVLTPSTDGDVEVIGGFYEDDESGNQQLVKVPYSYEDEDGNKITSPFKNQIVIPLYRLSFVNYLLTKDSAANLVPVSSGTKVEVEEKGGHHKHVYEWETYKAATATTDGVMRYRCKTCGTVEYEVPTAAYYVFNKDAQQAIKNAAAGATVKVETQIFISFHEMVAEALAERPDVTLVVDYKNAGKSYEMTIPAGSGDTLNTLFGDSQFAGFLYLGGAFATVEK